MAGLMKEQAPQQPEQEMAHGNVDPAEQAQYDRFVNNGMELMNSEKTMPQLLKTLEGDGDPVEGLANALFMIVSRLDDSASGAGAEISGDVKMHAGQDEFLPHLVELAEAAGVHGYTPEEQEAALFKALDLYRDNQQQQGKLPTEELGQDMNDLVAADQQGRLDEMVPGATEYAQRGQPQEEKQGLMRG
jgi:hypothetical protein